MTLTDTHQPRSVGDTTKPSVFVDGASGTTGLGIQERLHQQNDVVVKSIAEEKRKELVKKYGDLAVAMLRKAAAAGSKEIGDLKDNPGFDLLRAREDFKKLSADLSAGSKGGT